MIGSGTARQWFPCRFCLYINFLTSVLVVIGAGAASIKIPVDYVATPSLLIIAFGSALLLWGDSKGGRIVWRSTLASGLILLAVIVALLPAWSKGKFVSEGPDAWAYSSLGQYLAKYERGPSKGLALVDQFAAGALRNTRFATPSLLALFASWLKSDTCVSTLPFALLILTQLVCGFTIFTRTFGGSRLNSIVAGLYSCLFGWVPEIVKLANYDALIFLSFLPFVLVRFRLLWAPGKHWIGILFFALNTAALTYTYPEGLAIAGVVFSPLLITALVRHAGRARSYGPFLLGSILAFLLASPYLGLFWRLLWSQFKVGSTATIARGVFPGLLNDCWFPAFFALGEQAPGASISLLGLILPTLLVILLIFGFRVWFRKQLGLLLCVPALMLLYAWQCFLLKYDYGLYKVITIGWILILPAVFIGLDKLGEMLSSRRQAIWISLLFVSVLTQPWRNGSFIWQQSRNRIEPYRQLGMLRKIIGNHTLRIICGSWNKEEWAVFYLRDFAIEVPFLMGYLRDQGAAASLTRARKSSEMASFTLIDSPQADGIWRNEVFSIHRTAPIEICGALGQRGLVNFEYSQGNRSLWLDNEPARMIVSSINDQRATLRIRAFYPGPSRPLVNGRHFMVRFDGTVRQFDTKGSLSYDRPPQWRQLD